MNRLVWQKKQFFFLIHTGKIQLLHRQVKTTTSSIFLLQKIRGVACSYWFCCYIAKGIMKIMMKQDDNDSTWQKLQNNADKNLFAVSLWSILIEFKIKIYY